MNRESRPPSRRLQIASWCLFDFANSSFTTVIITVVYAVYFASAVVPGEGGPAAWSAALTVSNLVIILTAPLVGALADARSRKKVYLAWSWMLCVLATAGLFLAEPGAVGLAVFFLVVANVAFATGENLIAGFLPELARPEEMGRISAWGWGVGYVGGLAALALSLPLVSDDFELGPVVGGSDAALRGICLLVAVFFLLGGLPTMLFVREAKGVPRPGWSGLLEARDRLLETWRGRAASPDLFRFLLALLFFSIGVYGVIGQAGIYGKRLFGLDQEAIIKVFMASQLFAAAGALWSGRLADRLGGVRVVAGTLVLWIAAGIAAIVLRSTPAFWAIAMTAGFAMGATLATARAVVGRLTPAGRSAETFGYWGLAGRLAALLAPAGNWALLAASGNDLRYGIAFYVACFAVGLVLLRRVRADA